MSKFDMRPVIIGVGQVVRNWNAKSEEDAPDPVSLCVDAAKLALHDSGHSEKVSDLIDTIAVVRTNQDSVDGIKVPFGRCANPPRTIEAELGLKVERAIYSEVGGNQPQALVNEFSQELYEGRSKAVLLLGAEAIATMKQALKARIRLDWSYSADGELEDRGLGKSLLTDLEMRNGLGYPTQTYPAFEQAYRSRLGLNSQEYCLRMSDLLARFSKIASHNPYAQFPTERTSEFLATASKENYPIADPYLKWHVAQDAVNQGASLVMTTAHAACKIGVSEDKLIWLHGHGQVEDVSVLERPDLSRSRAIDLVLQQVFNLSGLRPSDITHFDIYSCFPVVVELAAEALGVDWRETDLTITGGLSFFGGAGNNYSMHAIASMVNVLRDNPKKHGLVMANGGFISKVAAGVYSAVPPSDWQPADNTAIQASILKADRPVILEESTDAIIESYTVTHGRYAPARGYVIARTKKGRILARAQTGHRATLRSLSSGEDPIGKSVRIVHRDGSNYFLPSDRVGETGNGGFLSRKFEHVKTERRGRVLEVTLNRPKSMNSLHSTAHFELAEIWDDFENDSDLWVAVLVGQGERAFCSGNDLKATARGGDMSTPKTGFAGLCNRFDRTKPIICAVNGVAMGGGLEIVLASDLAIAEEHARFALPEVKVGLFAAAGGVQRLTRQIGRKAAMELILTGRHISAQEALDLGLVNSVCPKGEVLERARILADEMLKASPSAIQATKRALNEMESVEGLQEALKSNAPIFRRLMRTNDFSEGIAAFAEKRAPEWTNS